MIISPTPENFVVNFFKLYSGNINYYQHSNES